MIQLAPGAGIPARYVNRHALITGPTGTGKTVTLMRLAESLASQGVPVFAPDVKGDLAPLSRHRIKARAPVWRLGADLLSRALELTDAQSGALEIAFAFADETGAPLDTLADFRALLGALASNPDSVAHLGHVTRASIGTIQRALLRLQQQGAADLFQPEGFDVASLLESGLVTVLDASQIYHSPRLYGAFLLYLLRDLATRLPELGDSAQPRLVLIFDEAHTIFHECSPALLRSIEATARLIRSKGVGLIWASQSAQDVPQIVRDQCATVIEHARAHGVGNCLFATLDNTGNLTPARMIRPTLPDCMTNPAPAVETAAAAPPPQAPALPPISPLECALVGGTMALPVAGVWAVFWAYDAGALGAIIAGCIGAFFALRR